MLISTRFNSQPASLRAIRDRPTLTNERTFPGTKIAYEQGGCETGHVSRVAPEVEDVLMSAMRDLLEASK
jgi:hypothetical protein